MLRAVRSCLGEQLPLLAAPSLLIAASSMALLCGCAPGEDVMTTATGPQQDHATGPHLDGAQPGHGNPSVTPRQRGYLDALTAAGVPASSELMALSIGSYICQAHGAGQTDAAVRDFVLPLVRGDLHDSHPDTSAASMTTEVNDATAAYMRIATDRLC